MELLKLTKEELDKVFSDELMAVILHKGSFEDSYSIEQFNLKAMSNGVSKDDIEEMIELVEKYK